MFITSSTSWIVTPNTLYLSGCVPLLVVHTCIIHLTICNDLVSIITCQNETPLQAPVVLDIRVDYRSSKDGRCMMFVTHECPKREHLDMEADLSIVVIPTSLGLLFFHGISVPLQIPINPIIDVILVNDAKVFQSIIGKIENLGFPSMYPYEVVCHDCDETLRIIAHAIEDVLLCDFVELVTFIKYEIDRFHFLRCLLLLPRQTNPDGGIFVIEAKVFLGSLFIHPLLVHVSF